MIFWTGYGIFAFLIPVAAFLIVFLIGGGDGTDTSDWLFFFPLLLSSLGCWFLGKRLNSRKGKILIDPDTGAEVLLRTSHSFWFIKLEYWGVVYGILSLIFLYDALTT